MNMPRSQPAGRSKLLSLRRRNKDPGTSSTQQSSQSKELFLPQTKENSVPIISKDSKSEVEKSRPQRNRQQMSPCAESNENLVSGEKPAIDDDGTAKDTVKEESSSPLHGGTELAADVRIINDNDGLGDLFFCQICQKELTRYSTAQREQHLNRCCDKVEEAQEEDAGRAGREVEQSGHTCVLCKKRLKTEQAKVSHMKTCARKKGISTNQLLEMVKMEDEEANITVTTGSSQATLCKDYDDKKLRVKEEDKACHSKEKAERRLDSAVGSGDGDFTDVLPQVTKLRKGRKRKRNEKPQSYLEVMEDEELQLALALSASMGSHLSPEPPLSTTEETGRRKKHKRGKKGERSKSPYPLSTVSSSQARNILAERAEQILEPNGCVEDGEIPCTPAFGMSELAQHPEPEATVQADESSYENEDDDEPILQKGELVEEAVSKLEEATMVDTEVPTKQYNSEGGEQTQEDLEVGVADVQTPGEVMKEDLDVFTTTNRPEASFHASCQELTYQTLWKLSGYSEDEDVDSFYVPALAAVVPPVKSAVCRTCKSDPCVALSAHQKVTTTLHGAADKPKEPIGLTPSSHITMGNTCKGVEKLISDMRGLISSPLLSDVVITTRNGTRVPAHAVILTCRCPALGQVISQFSERPVLLDFSEFDEESVFAFLEYIYTGSIPLLKEDSVRQQLASIAQRWSVAEIAALCRDWNISADCDMSREEKSTITSPALSTPNSHSRTESSDTHTSCVLDTRMESSGGTCVLDTGMESDNALETPTHMAAEYSSTHLPTFVADSALSVSSNVSITTPSVSESCADTSQCMTLFDEEMVVTLVVNNTAETTVKDNTELKGKDEVSTVAIQPVGSIATPPVSESYANASQCLFDEELVTNQVVNDTTTEISAKVDTKSDTDLNEDDEVSIVATLSAPKTADDSTKDENAVDCSTTVEANLPSSKISENTTKASHSCSESDVISVSTNQSPVICVSTSSEESKSGSEPDKICLSEAGSDNVLLLSDSPTPSDDILQGTVSGELSPSSVVDLDRKLSSVTTTPHVCSPPSSPVVIEVSPVIEQHPQIDHQLHCPVELDSITGELPTDVQPFPTPPVDFKTPHIERSASSKQGLVCEKFITPACSRLMLESDDNITPMPAYQTMPTPILKEECSKFGVRPLPKKKMIAKLHEIYEYTHPLVDKDGNIVTEVGDNAQLPTREVNTAAMTRPLKGRLPLPGDDEKRVTTSRAKTKSKRKDCQKLGDNPEGGVGEAESISQRIQECIMSDKDLYQDILMYKPLELSTIQARLKTAGVSIGRERLADVLDHWCVTYSVPRSTPPGPGSSQRNDK